MRAWVRAERWFLFHLEALFGSLGQLWGRPAATFMTAAVVGIALALPAGLYQLVGELKRLAADWDAEARISLYLKAEVDEGRARQLAETLRREERAEVQYISRAQALEEFRTLSGFGDALKGLPQNPLPAVLVVRPAMVDPIGVERLLDRLRLLPEVDQAQLDMAWVKRLRAAMEIGQRGVAVLAGLLGMAVLLGVGNTIRLTIQSRRDEIVVTKLIGATDAFIRRPFLYTGFWYGLIGGVLALALVNGSLLLLEGPVLHLAALYASSFRLAGPDMLTSLAVIAAGTLLGLLGAWLAVGRHLREIEPA